MQDELSATRDTASMQNSSADLKVSVGVLIMNLPFRVRWQDLKDLCRQVCQVERADVALEVDGRSRGFGEVICPNMEEAQKLFKAFDGYEWQNRRLNVILMDKQNQARPYLDNIPGPSRPYNGPSSPNYYGRVQDFRAPVSIQPPIATDDKLLFIGNLPFSMQWQDLKDLLRPAGRVSRTDISMSTDGRSRGWGTALFYTAEEARNAVEMFNETEVNGRRIKVRLDRLGGRGAPGYPTPSPNTAMQQPHPASFPLQQNPNSTTPYGRYGGTGNQNFQGYDSHR